MFINELLGDGDGWFLGLIILITIQIRYDATDVPALGALFAESSQSSDNI